MIWDDLLLQLAKDSNIFVKQFTIEKIAHLAKLQDEDPSDPKVVLHFWLERMLFAKSWAGIAGPASSNIWDLAMGNCCLRPSRFSSIIGNAILQSAEADEDFVLKWEAVFRESVFVLPALETNDDDANSGVLKERKSSAEIVSQIGELF